jgi:hypothetical protein
MLMVTMDPAGVGSFNGGKTAPSKRRKAPFSLPVKTVIRG